MSKIENDPFIKWAIKDCILDNVDTALESDDINRAVESIIEKVSEFVNENYSLK